MKNVILSQDLRNKIENVINSMSKANNVNISEVIENLSKMSLFKKDVITRLDEEKQNIFYMYHEINKMSLEQIFSKVELKKENIEYYANLNNIVVYNICYNVVYNDDVQFDLYVSYNFVTYKIASEYIWIEPYMWVESEVYVDLLKDNIIIWNKEYNFNISNTQYMEEVSKLDIMLVPKCNREYEIVTINDGIEKVDKCNDDFYNVLKSLFKLLVADDNIEKRKDFFVKCNLIKDFFINTNVESYLMYGSFKIGEYNRVDTLFKYEIIFKVEGIDNFIKVYVYLTQDEYSKVNKIGKYILNDKCRIKKVNKKKSLYAENIFYLLNSNYSHVFKMVEQDIFQNIDEILKSRYDECYNIIKYFSTLEYEVIDISGENVPSKNAIFFKNVLKEKNINFEYCLNADKSQEYFDKYFGKIEIIRTERDEVITYKAQKYLLSQFIIFTNENVIFVESYSPIMQLMYTNCQYKINLPVIFSDNIYFIFKYIDTTEKLDNLKAGNLDFFDMSSINKLNNYGIFGYVNKTDNRNVINYINKNYKELFCDFTINAKKNIYNLSRQIDSCEKSKLCRNLNLYDIVVEGKCDKNKISLRSPIVWSGDYYDDGVRYACYDLYTNGYIIGKYMTYSENNKKELSLELRNQSDDNYSSSADEFLSIIFDIADFGCKITLYELLEDIEKVLYLRDENNKIEYRRLDETLPLDKIYIQAIREIFK